MKIWDNYNKQWLQVMAINFNEKGEVWKIAACKPGDKPISDGWYDLHGDDLQHIGINDTILFNQHLVPKP